VLLNLVGNGVKFTEAGEVHVGVSILSVEDGRVRLEVRVRDTGPGIAVDAQSRLFEPFTQGDGSISRRYGGTGLGLAICRRLVERMGGSIALVSQPGAGSEFVFDVTMAMAARELPAPHQSGMGTTVAQRPLRILLAEDNATNRMVAMTRLEGLGHGVDAVEGGEDAVRQVQEAVYDLVLMDVMMPGMDGLAATRAIRGLKGAVATVPIVALTANVFPDHRDACRAAGMDDFLGKPLTPAALDRVLARAMNGTLREGRAGEAPHEVLARLAAEFGAEGAREVLAAFIGEARGLVELVRAKELAGDATGRDEAVRALSEAAETLGLTGLVGVASGIGTAAPSERLVLLAALGRMIETQGAGVPGAAVPGAAVPG
jgi:CheY-like chemotaxis protein